MYTYTRMYSSIRCPAGGSLVAWDESAAPRTLILYYMLL